MSGPLQQRFVEIIRDSFPQYFTKSTILEIGSCDINGSIRGLFINCQFTGVDIIKGPSVDVVCNAEQLSHASSSYDVVISCQCFEHNQFWASSFANMIRMLRPGGLCIITSATIGMFEHGTQRMFPGSSLTSQQAQRADYYRNLTMRDFKNTMMMSHFDDFLFYHSYLSADLFLVAIKAGDPAATLDFAMKRQSMNQAINFIDKLSQPIFYKRLAIKARTFIDYSLLLMLGNSRAYYNAQYHRFKFNTFRKRLFNKRA